MRYWDTEIENNTPPMPLWFAIAVWVVVIAVMVGGYGLLDAFSGFQMNDEAPEYTCAPGTQYTTKEC